MGGGYDYMGMYGGRDAGMGYPPMDRTAYSAGWGGYEGGGGGYGAGAGYDAYGAQSSYLGRGGYPDPSPPVATDYSNPWGRSPAGGAAPVGGGMPVGPGLPVAGVAPLAPGGYGAQAGAYGAQAGAYGAGAMRGREAMGDGRYRPY